MTTPPGAPLEEQIAQWRGYVRRRRAIDARDVQELESHLRDQMAALTTAGLASDEAFLVAVKRMGSLDMLSREFAREHSERLWKQLVISDADVDRSTSLNAETLIVFALAAAAAAAVKVPELFGKHIVVDGDMAFYKRNASFFAFVPLAIYFGWKRGLSTPVRAALATSFALAMIVGNVYAFVRGGSTENLTALHLPIALWLAVGIAYTGGHWFAAGARMNFVRFSGELFIYYVLMGLGGGLLTFVTMTTFLAIGVNAGWFVGGWLLPCGAAGAVIVASWLVEAKQSVIENMAPVLTRLFTPLFTIILLALLVTMAWTGTAIDIKREVLISFDLLLVLVVGLMLYALSARDAQSPPDFFDALQLLLVVSALAVDVLTLTAIAGRINDFGFTPNRVAALGENIILLVNLVWTAWLYIQFIRRRVLLAALERWQMDYLPVYSAWAAFVVVAFPPLFRFM